MLRIIQIPLFLFMALSVSWAQPGNNTPCTAAPLNSNSSCSFQLVDNTGATNSGIAAPSCGGDNPGQEDVWFTVTVPATGNLIIDTDTNTLQNIAMALYSAPSCAGPFTEIVCDESSSGGNMPQISLTNQTPGQVLYLRVWDIYAAGFFGIGADPREQGSFFLCFVAPPPPPFNDDPCQAITLVPGSSCNYIPADNIDALNTSGVPTPSCGGLNPGVEDVWFVSQVPASGGLIIDTDDGTLNNVAMAAYTASSCTGTFSEIACDENSSSNGNMPRLNLTGLTPGSYVFIRVWDVESNGIFGIGATPREQGTFSICAQETQGSITGGGGSPSVGSYTCGSTPPAGNTCATATPICTFDGYCGSTSGYTADYWFSGGNGLGGPLNANGVFCGSIENNSFISFVAGASTVQLEVEVSGGASACDEGVQFMMFGDNSGAAACGSNTISSFGCESPMPPGSNTFDATGLVAGQQYYLMVDGFAGDICDYQINAISGVLVEMSAGPDKNICLGESVNLTIFGAGTGTITWSGPFLSSTSGQTVTATPTSTGVFQYIVNAPTISPLCTGQATDADTILVNVSTGPTVNINAGSCNGNSITLTASGATNYTWSPPVSINTTSGSTVQVSPASPTTYTVNGTTASGCLVSQTVNVPACGVILEQNLLSFEGTCEQKEVQLSWEVEADNDLDQFTIYSSPNGIDWEAKGELFSSTQQSKYSYTISDPQHKYYKIGLIDKSGESQQSGTIAVNCQQSPNDYYYYVDGNKQLNIYQTTDFKGPAQVRLSDLNGRLLHTEQQNLQAGSNHITLDVSTLPAGVYVLHFSAGQQTYHDKIIIH